MFSIGGSKPIFQRYSLACFWNVSLDLGLSYFIFWRNIPQPGDNVQSILGNIYQNDYFPKMYFWIRQYKAYCWESVFLERVCFGENTLWEEYTLRGSFGKRYPNCWHILRKIHPNFGYILGNKCSQTFGIQHNGLHNLFKPHVCSQISSLFCSNS